MDGENAHPVINVNVQVPQEISYDIFHSIDDVKQRLGDVGEVALEMLLERLPGRLLKPNVGKCQLELSLLET